MFLIGGDQKALTGTIQKVLEGFKLSLKSSNPPTIYPPPQIPRNFRPNRSNLGHRLGGSAGKPQPESERVNRFSEGYDAGKRAEALGEQPEISKCGVKRAVL